MTAIDPEAIFSEIQTAIYDCKTVEEVNQLARTYSDDMAALTRANKVRATHIRNLAEVWRKAIREKWRVFIDKHEGGD